VTQRSSLQQQGDRVLCLAQTRPCHLHDRAWQHHDAFGDMKGLTCRTSATMCMAQHDLFQMIPELEADIQPPPFQEAVERLYKRNAWIGPAGDTSPYAMCNLHVDHLLLPLQAYSSYTLS
jgi:hypothetical protein